VNQVPRETGYVPEHLVIVTGHAPEETSKRLGDDFDVTQRVSKRVFLVRPSATTRVSEVEGLHIFSTPDIPQEVLSSLDDKEFLFVSAWRTRLQEQSKKRPGEGLDWDHPGFKPPR